MAAGDKFRIFKSVYHQGAVTKDQYPNEQLPEFAIVGKSNVGKSSFINTMVSQNGLARISRQPGKTRIINFFLTNDKFFIVDLPGYGFAKVSKSEKNKWGKIISEYFDESSYLELIIMLVDIRHKPTAEDMKMLDYIEHYEIPVILAATKSDKIGKTRWGEHVKTIRNTFDLPEDIPIIPFSSVTGQGKDKILKIIKEMM